MNTLVNKYSKNTLAITKLVCFFISKLLIILSFLCFGTAFAICLVKGRDKYMLKIIVATHGRFSEELVKSAFMILGEQSNISAITFLPGEGSEDLIAKYEEALQTVSADDQVIFLVDLFGGSPFNAAARIVSENTERYRLVAGVNLAMLIELSTSMIDDLDQLVSTIVAQGKESVVEFKLPTQEDDEDMDLDLEG